MRKNKFIPLIVLFSIALFQIIVLSKYVTISPVVDGWAVLNRIMLFKQGNISFINYIFDKHGAHYHSLIYLFSLIDFEILRGRQYLTYFLSVFSLMTFAILIAYFLFQSNSKIHISRNYKYILSIAVLIFLLSPIDLESSLLPFQFVLVGSKLIYFIIIFYSIKSILENKLTIQITILMLASLAMTMHGIGIIFGLTISIIYIALSNNNNIKFIPVIGFMIFLSLDSKISNASGEIGAISSLGIDSLKNLIFGVFAYYSTPISFLFTDKKITLLTGSLVFFLNLFFFIRSCTTLSQRSKNDSHDVHETIKLSMQFFILIIFLSSVAASLFWIVRSGSGVDSWQMVMSTARYVSYSSIAYVYVVYSVLEYCKLKKIFTVFFSSLLIYVAFQAYKNLDDTYRLDLIIKNSIAAISTGIKVDEKEGNGIWPENENDWYWKNALPKTIMYLKDEKLGPWYKVPALGAQGDFQNKAYHINILSSDKISNQYGGIYKVRGMLRRGVDLNASLIPITDGNNIVVGYGYLDRPQNDIEGIFINIFVRSIKPPSELFAAQDNSNWFKFAQGSQKFVYAFDLTNSEWRNGFSKKFAGFFVENSKRNADLLKKGTILKFSDGQIRVIVNAQVSSGYLNIFLDGPLLDSPLVSSKMPIIILE